jgi:hypothetical protein
LGLVPQDKVQDLHHPQCPNHAGNAAQIFAAYSGEFSTEDPPMETELAKMIEAWHFESNEKDMGEIFQNSTRATCLICQAELTVWGKSQTMHLCNVCKIRLKVGTRLV